ncbi:hypothetical protein HYC85_021334 [Camellia sinensis]|uniref:Peroxisomal membrane protein PMP22 n=1 Tax=Camellia sinensis TaxID=4442 RepID=A0A7J7GI84_CAMSI|nr:hypothetical protein HYC85_021334 [Camellia sinensis]
MSEIVKKGWNKYLLQLQLNPLRTKAITSGVLIGSSDIIAQKITGVKKLQFRIVLLLMLYGLLYSGPFGHFFYKLMDLIIKGKKGNKTVAKKVLLEQLTSSPWNNMLFMMYYGVGKQLMHKFVHHYHTWAVRTAVYAGIYFLSNSLLLVECGQTAAHTVSKKN